MKPLVCLLIDDDSEESEIFEYALEELDFSVKCVNARGGREALQYLQTCIEKPDFIFLDLNMPKMNGTECLTAIRQMDRFFDVPVILYSNSFTEEQQQQLQELGATGFVTKTCSVFDLYSKLAVFFSQKKQNVSRDLSVA